MLHFAVPVARISITSTRAVRNPREKRTDEDAAAAVEESIYTSASLSPHLTVSERTPHKHHHTDDVYGGMIM